MKVGSESFPTIHHTLSPSRFRRADGRVEQAVLDNATPSGSEGSLDPRVAFEPGRSQEQPRGANVPPAKSGGVSG